MGRKGVDARYGRGMLNINRALKPVNGRISLKSGAFAPTGSGTPFTALSTVSQAGKSMSITDEFNRDFQLSDEVDVSESGEQVLPFGGEFAPGSYFSVAERDGEGYTFDGFRYRNSIALDLNVATPSPFRALAGSGLPGEVDYLPDMIADLSTGSTHLSYRIGQHSNLFAVISDDDTDNPTRPDFVGWSTEFQDEEGSGSTGLTVAAVRETGRFGVTSDPAFGFGSETGGLLMEVGRTHSWGRFDLGGSVSTLFYPEGLDGQFIQSSGFGVASASLNLGYALDEEKRNRLTLGVSSGNFAYGDFTSQLADIDGLDDIYGNTPTVSLGYESSFLDDRADLRLAVTTNQSDTLAAVRFGLKF